MSKGKSHAETGCSQALLSEAGKAAKIPLILAQVEERHTHTLEQHSKEAVKNLSCFRLAGVPAPGIICVLVSLHIQ